MKKIFLFFLLQTIAIVCYPESKVKIDSLEKIVADFSSTITKKTIDTTYLQSLNSLCLEYRIIGEYGKALDYGHRALAQIEQIEQSVESPLQNVFQNIKEFQKLKAQTLRYIGTVYGQQNNNPVAIEYFFKSLAATEKTGDKTLLAGNYNNIGLVFTHQGKYLEAIAYYLKSLKIMEEMRDKMGIARVYHNIGLVYKEQKNYEKALNHYFKSLEINEGLHNKTELGQIFNNIGNIYEAQGNNAEAMLYYLRSLKSKEEIGDRPGAANVYHNIGLIYNSQKNFPQALSYYFMALKFFEEADDKGATAISYHSISHVYLQQENYSQAISYAEKSLFLFKEIGDRDGVCDVHLLFGIIYAQKGDFQKAYQYEHQYVLFNNTLHNEKIHRQINEIQTRYETEKKEQENILLKKNNEIQQLKLKRSRVWVYSLGSFLALSFIIFILLYNRYRIKRKLQMLEQQKKEANIRQQMTDLELKALRAQMDPHFIFNCINSIQHCVNNNELDAADNYLSKFAKLLRLMLETSRSPDIRLADEIKLLELYLEMESLRFKNKFQYEIETEENLDIENIEIPTMLIQPYVENALKHGIRHKSSKGKISIRFKEEKDNLLVEVEDNGIGRKLSHEVKDKNESEHHSLGMTVTQERLEILNAQKGNSAQVKIHDLVDVKQQSLGTKVDITIPI